MIVFMRNKEAAMLEQAGGGQGGQRGRFGGADIQVGS